MNKKQNATLEKNYITPAGFRRLEEEFRYLKNKERPEVTQVVSWAAENGDRSENGDYIYGKKRLREIDRRMRFLAKQIENAEIIDPSTQHFKEIRFGATVTIIDENNVKKRFSIVGVDEVDASTGKISWRSPLARALLSKKEGDLVTFSTPRGEQEVEIEKIEYVQIA
ncbi:MAG: transcription elongation factor GreB [SAR324 cluster bacterium]|uniref:Transcription elongation factor GreB n=1 Tax=SAR324 cluster bacterium TaxID=2024889 RepID=A0A7X9FS51_9DELT|nr:transcription elongation factor GreB [SAR324 cluster bacterium]